MKRLEEHLRDLFEQKPVPSLDWSI